MKDPTNDLADRLALLHSRYTVAFATSVVTPANPSFLVIADALVHGLRVGLADAVSRTRGVVDPADLGVSEFWGTPLGRLLFAAGGWREEAMPQALAALVLGCSRQWVNTLMWKEGKLRQISSGVGGRVHAGDVQDLLKTKIDSLVK